jgi:tetratricopeptide (TPR) repeat protein
LLGDPEEASAAYQHALRANPRSIQAMNGMSSILRAANQWAKAIEYLQSILKLDGNNGEVWGSLGSYILQSPDGSRH